MEHIENDDNTQTLNFDISDLADHVKEQAAHIIAEVTGWEKQFAVLLVIGTPDGEVVSSSNVMPVSALSLGANWVGKQVQLLNAVACERRKQERESMQ